VRVPERLRHLLSPPRSGGVRRAAVTALVLVLLAATAAAFAVAERLKLQRAPLTAPRFTRLIGPECTCESASARLRVRLRKADRLDVSIVTMEGQHVRTVETDAERGRGRVAFRWDGRDDRGDVVPDGRYRVRFHLDRADRTITVPTPIRVDSTPPTLTLVSARPTVIVPMGTGFDGRVLFTYRTNERAYPLLLVDGKVAVHGRSRRAGEARARWGGRLNGRSVRPGSYEAQLFAVDLAGNRSEPVSVSLRVRRP
jgi:hypothetical protein